MKHQLSKTNPLQATDAKTPNAKTQAAMRDADAWVVKMRAKESWSSQSSINAINKKASSFP